MLPGPARFFGWPIGYFQKSHGYFAKLCAGFQIPPLPQGGFAPESPPICSSSDQGGFPQYSKSPRNPNALLPAKTRLYTPRFSSPRLHVGQTFPNRLATWHSGNRMTERILDFGITAVPAILTSPDNVLSIP